MDIIISELGGGGVGGAISLNIPGKSDEILPCIQSFPFQSFRRIRVQIFSSKFNGWLLDL